MIHKGDYMNIKNIVYVFSFCVLASISSESKAAIYGNQEEMEGAVKHSSRGQYQFIKGKEGATHRSEATATVWIQEGQTCLSLTSAHAIYNSVPEERRGLLISAAHDGEKSRFYSIVPLSKYECAEGYKPEAPWNEQVANDLALAAVKRKHWPFLTHFEGKLYQGPLREEEEYPVLIHSQGPAFDTHLSSYKDSIFQQVPTVIHYDQKGFFFRTQASRDFYLLYNPLNTEWFFDILPAPGSTSSVSGDSGSLVTTLNGEILALHTGKSWEEFYRDNEELSKKLKALREKEEPPHLEELLVQIHEVADSELTRHIKTPEGYELYGFTLKPSFASLKAIEYFTPLPPHKKFIDQFTHNYWQVTSLAVPVSTYKKVKGIVRVLKDEHLKSLKMEVTALSWVIEEDQQKIKEKIHEITNLISRANELPDEDPQKGNIIRQAQDQDPQEHTESMLRNYQQYEQYKQYIDSLLELRQANEDLLDWFENRKNILKSGGPYTEEDTRAISRIEALGMTLPEHPTSKQGE